MRKVEMTELRHVEAGGLFDKLFKIDMENSFLSLYIFKLGGYLEIDWSQEYPVIEFNVYQNSTKKSHLRDITINFNQVAEFFNNAFGGTD